MHSHLHRQPFHPPDPANASAAGPAATAAGPSPGEGANASRVLQTTTAGTQKTSRHTNTHMGAQTENEATDEMDRKQK